MNPISSFKMGRDLTKLTDIFELVEKSKRDNPVGAGGLDALDQPSQRRYLSEFEIRFANLKKYPPYEVTKAIIGNFKIVEMTNNQIRGLALEHLFETLVSEGIALKPDDFDKAFGQR